MFMLINAMFLVAAVLLILLIAATGSIPSRQVNGLETPEGERLGSTLATGRGTARVLRSRPAAVPRDTVGVASP